MPASTIKERPILFSTPMVKAILAGRKTKTRRIVKGSEDVEGWTELERLPPIYRGWWSNDDDTAHASMDLDCPYGNVGDRLWVRETHALLTMMDGAEVCAYRASCDDNTFNYVNEFTGNVHCIKVEKWTPSIHMPRRASRIDLLIKSVQVERLHEITDEDALDEGIPVAQVTPGVDVCIDGEWWPGRPIIHFRNLWEEINGKGSWSDNPWVWVVEFEREIV